MLARKTFLAFALPTLVLPKAWQAHVAKRLVLVVLDETLWAMFTL
jgi:hypothetical protein